MTQDIITMAALALATALVVAMLASLAGILAVEFMVLFAAFLVAITFVRIHHKNEAA